MPYNFIDLFAGAGGAKLIKYKPAGLLNLYPLLIFNILE